MKKENLKFFLLSPHVEDNAAEDVGGWNGTIFAAVGAVLGVIAQKVVGAALGGCAGDALDVEPAAPARVVKYDDIAGV